MNSMLVLWLAIVGATLAADPNEPDAVRPKAAPVDQFVIGQVKEDAHRKKVDEILNSKIDMKYHEMPLLDVLAGIQAKTGLNIVPETKAIERERADALQSPVTIDVKDMTVRSLLRTILRDCGLEYFYRDEAIVVTTEAMAWKALETRVYPVGDLVGSADGEPPHVRKIRPNGPWGQNNSEPNTDVDDLIDAITETVASNSWTNAGGAASIKFVPTALALVISQRREVLEEIESLLTKLREVRDLQLGAQHQPNPADLLVFAYAMPRHAPIWQPAWPGSPAQTTNALQYEAELKTSLANAAATAKEFATVIPQVIEPTSWKATGGNGEIFVVNDRLVVRQTAAIHRRIANLLSDSSAPVRNPTTSR